MRAHQLHLCSVNRRVLSALTAVTLCLAYAPTASAAEPPADEGDTEASEQGARAADEPSADPETAPGGDDGEDVDGDADGEDPDGEETEGEQTEGEQTEGEETDGEETEGEEADGEEEPVEEETEAPEPPVEEAEEPVSEMEAPEPAVPVAPVEPEDERGPPPMYGEREATGKGLLIAGGVVTAGGLAFLGTSIAITRCDPAEPGCQYGDQDLLLIPSAVAITGVGAMLLVAGGINMVRYKKWQRGELKTTFAPAPMRNGAGLTASGRF